MGILKSKEKMVALAYNNPLDNRGGSNNYRAIFLVISLYLCPLLAFLIDFHILLP
jgi:hypothetical protein